MKDIADSTLAHFRQMESLSVSLAEKDLAIFEHYYDVMAFGSFSIVVGRSKRRLKFEWDGKEFCLVVYGASFSSSRSIANWTRKEYVDSVSQIGTNPFPVIREVIEEEWGQ